MNNKLTYLAFVLDRSGSMHNLIEESINGYNSLIKKQKDLCKEGEEALVTTVIFDNEIENIYDNVDIKKIEPLTEDIYYARGCTALLDALGTTIISVGKTLSNMKEEDRPAKVIVTITTDGLENASREFTKSKIKEMITHQQEKYNWTFVFLGANMDAIGEAESLGINKDFARNYTANKECTSNLYSCLSESMCKMRTNKKMSCKDEKFQDVMDDLDNIK